MVALTDIKRDLVKRQDTATNRFSGKFEVVTTAPFEVWLDGIEVAVPGIKIDGPSYSVGTTGVYFLVQGLQPICLPTVS